jgi:hypothetical protein
MGRVMNLFGTDERLYAARGGHPDASAGAFSW